MPFDLGLAAALWVAVACFVAAFVRGYCGFGFAALTIAGAGLVTDPLPFVAVVVMADMVLTAGQLRSILPDIDWRRVGGMCAGAVVAVPIGVWAVTRMGEDAARAAISLFILAMCAVLASGWTLTRPQGVGAHAGVGVLSGLANGAAVGGLPVAAFFAAQPIPAATFRATVIVYFTLLDIWTLPNLAIAGRVTADTLLATALALPVMALGVRLGSRRFLAASPTGFRSFAIGLLAVLALIGLVRALA